MRLLLGLVLAVALASPSLAAADKFRGFKLKTLDGVEKTLPDVLGKATLVVFFFPTCPYCNAAFPKVQKIYDTYREQGLSMVVDKQARLFGGEDITRAVVGKLKK